MPANGARSSEQRDAVGSWAQGSRGEPAQSTLWACRAERRGTREIVNSSVDLVPTLVSGAPCGMANQPVVAVGSPRQRRTLRPRSLSGRRAVGKLDFGGCERQVNVDVSEITQSAENMCLITPKGLHDRAQGQRSATLGTAGSIEPRWGSGSITSIPRVARRFAPADPGLWDRTPSGFARGAR